MWECVHGRAGGRTGDRDTEDSGKTLGKDRVPEAQVGSFKKGITVCQLHSEPTEKRTGNRAFGD